MQSSTHADVGVLREAVLQRSITAAEQLLIARSDETGQAWTEEVW